MDGPWDIDPDEEEAMIAEQAEHDQAAADAAADVHANGHATANDNVLADVLADARADIAADDGVRRRPRVSSGSPRSCGQEVPSAAPVRVEDPGRSFVLDHSLPQAPAFIYD